MDTHHSRDQLSSLVHSEALLKRLKNPRPVPREQSPIPQAENTQPSNLNELVHNELRTTLSSKLGHQIGGMAVHTHALFETLLHDVLASRDKLLLLNPGRRNLIERRLEFIARKVARARGEKMNRSLVLPEILRESYKDGREGFERNQKTLGQAAWEGFAGEVAFAKLLELVFLKCLDFYGHRKFPATDLTRLNYAAHEFLAKHANGFARDKHCWNFVRSNLYSWYTPSRTAIEKLEADLNLRFGGTSFAWSDRDVIEWIRYVELAQVSNLAHLDFRGELSTANVLIDLVREHLNVPLTSLIHGAKVPKKVFLPCLELGGVGLQYLDSILEDGATQIHRGVWAAESECFELVWTEVMALLKILRTRSTDAPSGAEFCSISNELGDNGLRLPQAVHVAPMLGLELHNVEQLTFGVEVARQKEGTAGNIQQLESFDLCILTDHIDRAKSARWMKALAEQLPYWRSVINAGTNLNWGELHLLLGLSKTQAQGYCIYLSHRVLPEGGDGEKLRKTILGMATLEYMLEIPEGVLSNYRYLYVFRKTEDKNVREQHHPRYGKLKVAIDAKTGRCSGLSLASTEESSSNGAEIFERGWEQLFVRGAAPLVRHLSNRFQKLFQFASVQAWPQGVAKELPQNPLFASGAPKMVALDMERTATGVRFFPMRMVPTDGRPLIFPHNPMDLPWIQNLMNSHVVQFWIRHQILAPAQGKTPRWAELRLAPLLDLTTVPLEFIQAASDFVGKFKISPASLSEIRNWALSTDVTGMERSAKFVALCRRQASLERVLDRYKNLFEGGNYESEELKPEAVTQFYPEALLAPITQIPQGSVRVQYSERNRSPAMPDNWVLGEVHLFAQTANRQGMPAVILIHTRQGPMIQISVPMVIKGYVMAQLRALKNYTWGETLSLLRVPRDVSLFAAQTSEISRVVRQTAQDMTALGEVIQALATDVFEVQSEMRSYLQ